MRPFSSTVLAALLTMLKVLASNVAHAEDFFVITATFHSQTEAQNAAATTGGWVLDTDLYSGLTPNLFAVVRGPFNSESAAKAERDFLTLPEFKGAYVKAGGASRLPRDPAGSARDAAVRAALLGEISVELEDHPGGENPCEPQEPYQEVKLSYMTVTRQYDARSDSYPVVGERRPLDLGAFSLIKRTGELKLMRACYE
jgi:hypothetical protein